jgi:hypothetical protein
MLTAVIFAFTLVTQEFVYGVTFITASPNGTPQLGEVHPVRRPLLSANQNHTPAALSPLRRQNPREEPGALAAHAGICAGGEEKSSSLPRPFAKAAMSGKRMRTFCHADASLQSATNWSALKTKV